MGRLNVSLSNETIKKIQEISKREGKTISSIVSESVSLYDDIAKYGRNRRDIEKIFNILSLMKTFEAIPVPSILLDFSISKCMSASSDETISFWKERGRQLGVIIKEIAPDIEDVKNMAQDYGSLLPLNGLEVIHKNDSVTVILTGTGYTKNSSLATAYAVEGFLESYGYQEFKIEVMEGFVKVDGKKK
ncbi:MAG: hypothetical protein ACP5RG_03170 [Thermoplasmata archaeon]